MAKMSRSGLLNQDSLQKFGNYLQVTLRNRVLIFDIEPQTPVPVDELSSSEVLMDPQRFVEGNI